MKTSHIVIAAFMLWSAGLANMCLAQVSAMGVPSASADSTQAQTEFLLVQLKNGAWFYGQVVEWNKKDQTLTLDTDSLGTILFRRKHITRTVPGPNRGRNHRNVPRETPPEEGARPIRMPGAKKRQLQYSFHPTDDLTVGTNIIFDLNGRLTSNVHAGGAKKPRGRKREMSPWDRNITFNWCANAAGQNNALLPINEQTWLITENY